MPKTIKEQLEDVWGDTKKTYGKVDYETRVSKTLQQFRWTIGDILKEFRENETKGLELAKKLLEE